MALPLLLGGKQKRMSLGTSPEVMLREARSLRDEVRALLAKGTNPRVHRKQKRTAVRLADENTFAIKVYHTNTGFCAKIEIKFSTNLRCFYFTLMPVTFEYMPLYIMPYNFLYATTL